MLFGLIGVILGTAIGVLPGIGPALTISLLLPLTFGLNPTSAFIMFGGIYYGAMYGGSTTSILVKTPGESASVVTALEGYQMAKRGRGGAALATAAIGSFVAGTFATLGLMLLARVLADVAVTIGAPEYFGIMLLALTAVTGLAGDSAPKAMFSTLLGLGISMIGIDLQTGQARFTFGVLELLNGVEVVVAAVGLFAVGEVLWNAGTHKNSQDELIRTIGTLMMDRSECAARFRVGFAAQYWASLWACCRVQAQPSPHFSATTWSAAHPNTPKSLGRALLKAWLARKRPTTRQLAERWCRCWRWASLAPAQPPSCWPLCNNTA